MRFSPRLFWLGAWGFIAACGSSGGQATQGTDSGAQSADGSSGTSGSSGSSGSSGASGSSGGYQPPSDDGAAGVPSDASGSGNPDASDSTDGAAAKPDAGTGKGEAGTSGSSDASGSSGGNQPPGNDGAAGVPSDASGSGNPDASGSTDGAAANPDAGTGKGDAGTPLSCKRGIASNAAPGAAFSPSASQPGITWWYNWATQGSGQGAGIDFVPMIWGAGSLHAALPAGSKYVLGFNEPNFTSQSNLTPAQAAADWPLVEAAAKATGALIVSPAVNFCGSASNSSQCTVSTVTDPYTYLKDFFAACSGCQVDYIAIHWYNCDLPSLKAYIEGNVATGGGLQGFLQFGKPIWLTEFSCGPSSSAAQQKTYMQAAVPYLESNPNVVRYSWFSSSNIASAQLANADGSLTDLGKTYVALPQSCK